MVLNARHGTRNCRKSAPETKINTPRLQVLSATGAGTIVLQFSHKNTRSTWLSTHGRTLSPSREKRILQQW